MLFEIFYTFHFNESHLKQAKIKEISIKFVEILRICLLIVQIRVFSNTFNTIESV